MVAASAATWGAGVEVVAALGHGRSYGTRSRFLCRELPGILECAIWPHLEAAPRVPTRALVTDVGNDIIYGFPPEQTLAWIEESIRRLQRYTGDIVLTGLPLASIRRLSPQKFRVFRGVIAPSCTLPLSEVIDRSCAVDAGLAAMATARGVRFLPLEPRWYGIDPIHIKRRFWRDAWQMILGTEARIRQSPLEAIRLYAMRADREWWFGTERHAAQTGRMSTTGARVWLY